jgi:kynureninase
VAGPLSDPHPELLEWRSEFPILETSTYLISNSLGAMPRGVEDSLSRYTREWRTLGVRAWHGAGERGDEPWWDLPVRVGDMLAPILGVATGSVAMHQNVSIALALFLSCIDYPQDRNRIVYTGMNFPSVRYLLEGERKKGAEIHVVPSADSIGVDLTALLDAIDERTRLVPISHVLFQSAYIQDAQAIARRCREVGALLMLDVYQSAGVVPLELEAWGVDAAVGGCLKWLCGGPGNCFLWVNGEISPTLEPAFTGWQSHKRPFGFEAELDRVEAGAWRYLTGTPNVPGLYAAIPGLQILNQIAPRAIRERSLYLTRYLIDGAAERGLAIHSPTDSQVRGGTVTIAHPRSEEMSRRLLAADIVCDYRPNAGIRLSPHFYSTVEECDVALNALAG